MALPCVPAGPDPKPRSDVATRRVVLVELYWTRDKDPRVPLGQASLAARLCEEPGVEVRCIAVPINDGATKADLVDRIWNALGDRSDHDADIAMGAYVWSDTLLREVMRELRLQGFSGRLIVGGPQVSYAGSGLEKYFPDADLFVRGYGEDALACLARGDDPASVVGVHRAGALDAVKHASLRFETLPSPWLDGAVPLLGQQFVRWETQRGCIFKCSFCQHRNPDHRPASTPLGWSRIEAEIDLLCSRQIEEIAVLDPIFNANRAHAADVLAAFAARGFSGRLSLQCRAEMLDDAFVTAAGALDVRLEFGLQTTVREEWSAVGRPNNLDAVSRGLARAREAGLDHEVSLIFGLPHQTPASFEGSVQWCLERQVPVIKAFPLLLLRGTPLEASRETWGLEIDETQGMPMVVASNSFNRADWESMNRVSQALRDTEGRHPANIQRLRALAERSVLDRTRFEPETNGGG